MEINMVQNFEGKREELAKTEQFFAEISDVPGFKERLQALLFKKTHKEQLKELDETLDTITFCIKDLPTNKKFQTMLEYILAFGNYMNGTSNRGGAWGFKLDALDKVCDLKGTTNTKKTLLTFIIEQMEENLQGDFIDKNMDLHDYELCAKQTFQ